MNAVRDMHAHILAAGGKGAISVAPLSDDDVVAIEILDEIDLAHQQEFAAALERSIKQDLPTIVDLSKATFIDSSIVRTLVWSHHQAASQGTPLVLQLGTDAIVQRVIDLAGLEPLVPRAHTREAALRLLDEQRYTVVQ